MSKTLLINGCSYAYGWHPSSWFSGYNIVNLAEQGGSNRRAMRTTIEWILENHNPDYVIIPITFVDRFETFFDSNRVGDEYVNINNGFYTQHPLASAIENFIVTEHSSARFDRLLTDIIMFDGFLSSRQIPYLMFNMCISNWPGITKPGMHTKLNYLSKKPNIIDFNFIGNKYLAENGARSNDSNEVDIVGKHYNTDDYHILESYLNAYR